MCGAWSKAWICRDKKFCVERERSGGTSKVHTCWEKLEGRGEAHLLHGNNMIVLDSVIILKLEVDCFPG